MRHLNLIFASLIVATFAQIQAHADDDSLRQAMQQKVIQLAAQARQTYKVSHTGGKSAVIFNHDGSTTFKRPTLLRGPNQLLISVANSDDNGVCRLLGKSQALAGTIEFTLNDGLHADIGSQGVYSSQQSSYENVYDSISCFNPGERQDTGFTANFTVNPDQSVTIFAPRIIRGTYQLLISQANSDDDGVCRLFGMDHSLQGTTATKVDDGLHADIGSQGVYSSQQLSYEVVYDSITCFDTSMYKTTAAADGTIFQKSR